jgi:AraC-like DNA-binding protein
MTPETTAAILEPQVGQARFELERRPPAPDLAAHVERHWIVSWDLPGGAPFAQRILPHPCVHIVAEPGLTAVWGIPLSVSEHRLEGSGTAVGTKFAPGGIAGFLDGPAFALNDRVEPLAEVFGHAGARLGRELAACAGDRDAHIATVEGFLRARMPDPDRRFDLVRELVSDMLVTAPETTVAELAERHAVSPRTVQRLFRDFVGVGPKWVLKRYRMHEAAERIAAGEADDAATLALDLGYFDQSHFIRDFTAQIGRSPGAYARDCASAAGRAIDSAFAGS